MKGKRAVITGPTSPGGKHVAIQLGPVGLRIS
jgi:hypothetical protein